MHISRTKAIISTGVALALFSVGTYAFAAISLPVGWGWGGTPSADGAYQGIGWINFNVDANDVFVPPANGLLHGYAWSSNYGWISFNSADLAGCPSGICEARRTGNTITGWARILSISKEITDPSGDNSGGFNGWISLSGTVPSTGAAYGVGTSNVYGWSSDLGWVDLSGLDAMLSSARLIICPAEPWTISQGATQQLSARYWANPATTPDCSTSGYTDVTDDSNTTWSSDAPGVATVTSAPGSSAPGANGLLTGASGGTATISATYSGLNAAGTVTVNATNSYHLHVCVGGTQIAQDSGTVSRTLPLNSTENVSVYYDTTATPNCSGTDIANSTVFGDSTNPVITIAAGSPAPVHAAQVGSENVTVTKGGDTITLAYTVTDVPPPGSCTGTQSGTLSATPDRVANPGDTTTLQWGLTGYDLSTDTCVLQGSDGWSSNPLSGAPGDCTPSSSVSPVTVNQQTIYTIWCNGSQVTDTSGNPVKVIVNVTSGDNEF
jgi:hypothetical protein